MLTGINITYDFGKMRAEALWSLNKFSIPYYADKRSGNLFKMYGSENQIFHFIITGCLENCSFLVKYRQTISIRPQLFRALLRPDDRLTINMIYRNYSPLSLAFMAMHLAGVHL